MNVLALDTTMDRIRAFYAPGGENIKLTKHEDDTREIWEAAWVNMLNNKDGGTKERTVELLKRLYKRSTAQAYRDISNAEILFGDVRKNHKEAIRYIVTEWAKEMFIDAKEKKDMDGMARALREINRANLLYKEDIDLPDPDKIQPPIQVLQINIDFLTSQFSNIIDPKAKAKINRLMEQITAMVEKGKINDYLDQIIDIPMLNANNQED
jgi:hypothetical protein